MNKEKGRVPKLRFPGFTEDWEQCKLGDFAEIVRGASPRPISDPKWFDNDSNVGWLRIADVTAQDGRIRYLEQKISELGQEKTRVIKTPHLLLSIAATVGKPVINYIPTGVHDGFLIFLNPKFNILYAFWWLEMFREKWNKYGQPGSQVNLNSDLVKNQVINIPNEKEQEKISSFLESLDKIITLHQRKLEHLNLKKKALLQKLFPKNGERYPELRFPGFTDAWEQRKLGEFVKIISGDAPSTFISGSCIYVKVDDLNYSDRIQLSSSNLVNINPKAHLVNKGATIFPKRGAAIMTNKVRIMGKDGYLDTNMMALIPEEIDKDFLFTFIQKTGLYKIADTSTIPQINNKHIEPYMIQVPNDKEQECIGVVFEKIDKIITLHQCKLEHLQLQKKALLQQMFV